MRNRKNLASKTLLTAVLSVGLLTASGAPAVMGTTSGPTAVAPADAAPSNCVPSLRIRGHWKAEGLQSYATWSVSTCGTAWKGALVMQNETSFNNWRILTDRGGGWYPMDCNLNFDCFNSLDPSAGSDGTYPGVHCTTGNFRAVMAIDGRWFYGPSTACTNVNG